MFSQLQKKQTRHVPDFLPKTRMKNSQKFEFEQTFAVGMNNQV
jgi:hypothetical protein